MVLIVIVIAAAALCRWGNRDESPADGEWERLVVGLSLLHGDTRLAHTEPPLANAVFAAGVDDRDTFDDLADIPSWEEPIDAAAIARGLTVTRYPQARQAIFEARDAATWFLIFAVLYGYAWAHRLFGFAPAVAVAVAIGFNPVLLGHAGYLGHDFVAAVAIVVVVGELVRATGPNAAWWARWLTLPAAAGLAAVTTHRVWIFVPIVALVLVVHGLRRKGLRDGLGATAAVLLMVATMVLSLNVSYGFARSGYDVAQTLLVPEPRTTVSRHDPHEMLELRTPLGQLPPDWVVPFPYAATFGMGNAWAHVERGEPLATFRGRIRPDGHWLYFPTLLLTKTPLWLLLVLGGAAVASIRRRRIESPALALLLGVTGLGLLIAMRITPNLGIGPVVHLELLLSLVAGVIAGRWWQRNAGPQGRPWIRWGTLALGLASLGTAVASGPRHRGAFNPLLTRTEGAEQTAVGDDIGQDQSDFAAAITEHAWSPLWVHHASWLSIRELNFHRVQRKKLRCRTRPPAGAYVAVDRRRLQTLPRCFTWQRELAPIATIGEHILVFQIPVASP